MSDFKGYTEEQVRSFELVSVERKNIESNCPTVKITVKSTEGNPAYEIEEWHFMRIAFKDLTVPNSEGGK